MIDRFRSRQGLAPDPRRESPAVETLESRWLLSAGYISSLTLVNADTGGDLMMLSSGVTLNLATLPTRNLNIRANTGGTVESVRFALDGNSNYCTESYAPYSLAGDSGEARYNAWTPVIGSHTLTVTPYSADAAAGTAGTALSVSFNVISQSPLPAAPTSLTTVVVSASRIDLHWADKSTNEQGFRIYRSTDNVHFSLIATAGANASAYSSLGLSASTRYYYRVRAYNAAGSSADSNTASAVTLSAAPPLPAVPQLAVNAANSYPLIRYSRTLPGGAHTNQPNGGGAPEVLAAAAFVGNTSADARLLQQMRFTITGGNDITANGGYPSQHERHVTAMYAIARYTPRIWNQLTAAEKTKIDLLMKAALVASAFTTSDSNPYILAKTQQRALDGDSNLGREWNPNYREGMVGGILVGMAYFGGAANAIRILDTYDHATFVSQLKANGLSNIQETFTWKAAHPTSAAPTGQMIQSAIRNYRYYGLSLNSYMDIYWKLASVTFGKTVNAGLNGGAGIGGAGRILSGADALPNKGALGMITEFDSFDARGLRSSATYAYDAFRIHAANHLVLLATGLWKSTASQAGTAVRQMNIGVTDLWYKLDRGYSDYANGRYDGTLTITTANRGFEFTRPLWQNVIKVYHGLR